MIAGEDNFFWTLFTSCLSIVVFLELFYFLSRSFLRPPTISSPLPHPSSSPLSSPSSNPSPSPPLPPTSPPTFSNFRIFALSYLGIFYLMTLGDWLQGPYLYSLYSAHGYSRQDIGWIFSIGFVSSLILGTPVGALAERYGRRSWSILYVVCYVVSCGSMHIQSTVAVVLGRVCGGVATSLLFRFVCVFICVVSVVLCCVVCVSFSFSFPLPFPFRLHDAHLIRNNASNNCNDTVPEILGGKD